ncbi:MAG: hypothetical protein KatS3mg102_0412 [Planctomycetota bacterium]|nr:MAG: hypothetical protein KatS3mg102_0412 [Planctomycetota bacterium]
MAARRSGAGGGAGRRGRRRGPRDADLHDPEFAALAPHYQSFPGFLERDFDAFLPDKQRSAAYNAERLVVKRKLAALLGELEPALAAAGLELEGRTSLSHPYSYNAWRVASMWAYFGRGARARAALKRLLGAELGADADPTYLGVVLLVEIDRERLAWGMKVHPAAWWDGQNLKRAAGEPARRAAVLAALRGLPRGFAMGIGGWQRRHVCCEMTGPRLDHLLGFYTPGEHWLEVLAALPRAEAIAAGAALAERLRAELPLLAPLWRAVAWSGGA